MSAAPLRFLARRPAQRIVGVAILALGIALPVTMFSILRGVVWRGLPFAEPHRLLQVDARQPSAGIDRMPVRPGDFRLFRERQRSFEELAAWSGVSAVVGRDGRPAERRNGAFVSSNLWRLLRVRPERGTGFGAAEDTPAAAPVVLISRDLWQGRYAGAAGVVGRKIYVNGAWRTVVGVMPTGFHFPLSQDFWFPLATDLSTSESRPGLGFQLVGRLRDGVTAREAQAELSALARGLERELPRSHRGVGVTVRPYVEAYTDPQMRSYLRGMWIAVFGVWLVACLNVANLQVGLGLERLQELAVRQALGAARRRLVGRLALEALLLAGVGGALAWAIAGWSSRQVNALVQPILRSFWIDVRLDGAVLAFLLAVTVATSLWAGLVPALRITRMDLSRVFQQRIPDRAGAPLGRFVRGLTFAQWALACGLLIPTLLLGKSLHGLAALERDAAGPNPLVAWVSLPPAAYPDRTAWAGFYGRLEERLAKLPGVERVAFASSLPYDVPPAVAVAVDGMAPPAQGEAKTGWIAASPELFGIFGVQPLAGRLFLPREPASGRVAVVSRGFAERFLGGRPAVGRRIRFPEEGADAPWRTIVGVVPELRAEAFPSRPRGFLPIVQSSGEAVAVGEVFVPFSQEPQRSPAILVRSKGEPLALADPVRRAVAAIEPEGIVDLQPLSGLLRAITWDYRLFGTLFIAFGAVSLLLAAVGLYAVQSLAVGRRTREIGVRMALGSTRERLLRLVLAQGLAPVAVALAVGLALSVALSRALAALLLGVAPAEPLLFLLSAALLLSSGALACLLPALRAAGLAPATALRAE